LILKPRSKINKQRPDPATISSGKIPPGSTIEELAIFAHSEVDRGFEIRYPTANVITVTNEISL